jgi:acyl dehydratase
MAEPTVFDNPEELKAAVGRHLGYSDWFEVTQERVNQFADATDDHQWIHVDPERAAKGPFGRTIAHGYLTLSLVSALLPQLMEVHNISMAINYGTNKVRFPSPVPVGSLIRASADIISADEVPGGVQVTTLTTIEREDSAKPCCVAESIIRYLASSKPSS